MAALALVLGVAMLRSFAGADTKMLVKGLRWFGAAVLLLAAIGLAAFDRVALALLAASMAWGLFTGGHVLPSPWGYRFGQRGTPSPDINTSSTVKTASIEMELDHASGAMRGRLLKGEHVGRALDDLDAMALGVTLRWMVAHDPESGRILEAYIERRFGANWRDMEGFAQPQPKRGNDRGGGAGRSGPFRRRYSRGNPRRPHRLIQQLHPDKGGSGYLAAKINRARDVLLG